MPSQKPAESNIASHTENTSIMFSGYPVSYRFHAYNYYDKYSYRGLFLFHEALYRSYRSVFFDVKRMRIFL